MAFKFARKIVSLFDSRVTAKKNCVNNALNSSFNLAIPPEKGAIKKWKSYFSVFLYTEKLRENSQHSRGKETIAHFVPIFFFASYFPLIWKFKWKNNTISVSGSAELFSFHFERERLPIKLVHPSVGQRGGPLVCHSGRSSRWPFSTTWPRWEKICYCVHFPTRDPFSGKIVPRPEIPRRANFVK